MKTAALALGLLLALPAMGQEAAHLRLAVERVVRHRIEAGLALDWKPKGSGCDSDLEASFAYTRKERWSFGLFMPATCDFSGGAREGARAWSWGEPRVSASYLGRGDALRLSAGAGYSYPLPREGECRFHAFTATLRMAAIRDPVVLSLGLDARFNLPREYEGRLVSLPPFSSLELSAWELLNDKIGYRVSISPGLSFGERNIGLDERPEPRWFLALGLALTWENRDHGFELGWVRSMEALDMRLRYDYRKEW